MASKTSRAKDVITKQINNYLKSTTDDYIRYYEGSPTYLTYYQLDDNASRQDSSLENVHSLVGKNTPNKYKRIKNLAVYGADDLNVNTMITNLGMQDEITGELIIIPDSIIPGAGDFFSFEHEGYGEHLFIVTDVQYDRPTPRKYYKIQFKIWPEEQVDIVSENLSGKYTMDYDDMGGDTVSLITEDQSLIKDELRDINDMLTERYVELFYDSDMDSFILNTGVILGDDTSNEFLSNQDFYGEYLRLWSPYLQTFIHNTGSMAKYNRNIMEEFFIPPITQSGHPKLFSDRAYNNSIFGKIEKGRKDFNIEDNFMTIDLSIDLTKMRNLQFFNTPGYTLLGSYKYANSRNKSRGNEKDALEILENIEFYKTSINIMDSDFNYRDLQDNILGLMSDVNKLDNDKLENEGYINDMLEDSETGEMFYLYDENHRPKEIFLNLDGSLIPFDLDSLVASKNDMVKMYNFGEDVNSSDITAFLDRKIEFIKNNIPLFYILRAYLLGDHSALLLLKDEYLFENNLETYVFGPIIIYLIKKTLNEHIDVEEYNDEVDEEEN